MKKLIAIFIALFWFSLSQAHNRTATQADIKLYGDYITIGDLILDTPTKKFPDGINQLRYNKISKIFPSLRENGIIWIDGNKIGPLCEIRLLNGTETTPWLVSSVTIKPIPNTRIDGIVTSNTYRGFLYLIQGLKNLRMEGSSERYFGLNKFPADKPFLKGRFGFGATSTGIYRGYHMFSISVLDGGSIFIEGFEGEHGFSIGRFQGGRYDWTVSLTIDNFYLHDSGSEGFYIGATHAPPYAKIKDLKISRGIFARTGSESLQLQHLVGNAHVGNLTIFSPDAGYLSQFEPWQDTGIQLIPDSGETILENLIIDSWGSNALNLFGTPDSTLNSKTTIRNILFNNGRGQAIYIHPSCKHGMNWKIDHIYIRKPNGEYYIHNNTPKPDWSISANNGTDEILIDNVFHDSIVDNPFQKSSDSGIGKANEINLPEVEYVNSGFYEPANKIKFYSQFYAKYFTNGKIIPVEYKEGDIIQDREPGFPPVWCKCIKDYAAEDIRPKNNSNCIVLTWDSKGVRSDQPNWNKKSEQKPYPPDDLRVSADSYYGKLNIGFIEER